MDWVQVKDQSWSSEGRRNIGRQLWEMFRIRERSWSIPPVGHKKVELEIKYNVEYDSEC